MTLDPSILSQPNIPRPLHGVNPRSIMGQKKWDVVRREVYSSTGYCCAACGVHKKNAEQHKWLEAHEKYSIDYKAQTVTLDSIVPLCHFCHSFCHSGLMRVKLDKRVLSNGVARRMLKHGLDVTGRDTPVFYGTIELAKQLGVNTDGHKEMRPECGMGEWSKWRMIWDGVEYEAKFKSQHEWERFYRR